MAFLAVLGCKAALTKVVVVGGYAVGMLAVGHLTRPRRTFSFRDDASPVRESDEEVEQLELYIHETEPDDTERRQKGQQGGGGQRGGQQGGGGQRGGQQGGGGQRGEDSDSEDEDSDQESEESESDEETDDENKTTGRKLKKKKKRGLKTQTRHQGRGSGQKQQPVSSHESDHNLPPLILMGLLNVRSLNNKISQILNLILKNRLDVFCTTETWSKDHTGETVLRKASPEDFTFCYQARPTRGGGAAVQVSPLLHSTQIFFSCKTTTFEVAATVLQHQDWDEPVLVISLYRRGATGTRFHKFLDEFQNVLCEIFSLCNNVIVTGDFNVWVDDLRRGRRFRTLLQAYELDQHVRSPTNPRGHTLDLVITRNVEVSRLFVQNDGISDHYSVYFSASPKSRRQKPKEPKKKKE